MLKSYIYFFIELLLIVLGVHALYKARKHCPSKIKGVAASVLIINLLRFITNIILFLSENILLLYIFKFFALANIATILITALLCLYIFLRNDEIKFDYVIMLSALLFIIYSVAAFNMEYYIQRTQHFGYIIAFKQWEYIELVFIAILSVFFVAAAIVLGRKTSNNRGLLFIIGSSAVTIGEIVIKICGMQVMTNLFFGDLIWMLVLQYALNTIKINKGR
ncbi:hypothetical protein [Clostridium thermarum]|uniref:hypothetical protein n=1 Tax=Clostridium thermarum TaxID=1716543 RepID=UPI0013D837E9|nr:hypothetical protein [Clostridium thermarum]